MRQNENQTALFCQQIGRTEIQNMQKMPQRHPRAYRRSEHMKKVAVP
ncbi:crotonobetainyl-CoA:carnitine CoA-transferase CaiB-like acyl-CoA transferase [Bacillus fengqiuensis]|nr:crotonobetainyl-CoA:carnitine CoA-transferase CaiB-like acyl-CoA transferase [Bacillus fengqiuensis]